MSIRHINAVWEARISDPQAKLVLMKLADSADKDGVCWPSITTISDATELHRATVFRKLDMLERGGWIARDRFKNGAKYMVNITRNQSHTATSETPEVVAGCDHLKGETSSTLRPVAGCDQSHTATQLVAGCDSTGRTQRLSITKEPPVNHQGTINNKSTRALLADFDAADDADGDWSESRTIESVKAMAELQRRINSLHPKWKKRPHFVAKELHALSDNATAWLAVPDEDWKLLGSYMDAEIPQVMRKTPGDLWQPDNRLALINSGPTAMLDHAERWHKKAFPRNGNKVSKVTPIIDPSPAEIS